MHPLYGRRNRLDPAHTGAMSAAGGIKGSQSATARNWTAGRRAAATTTLCVSVPFRAAGTGGAVLAVGRPGWLPRPEDDLVRGAVPFVESDEYRLGNELGRAAQHLPGELDRQQVLHVHGGAVTAAGLFLRGHCLAAVEPHGETQAVGTRAADAMNYAQYWKAGAEKAALKHNTHIEKCNRVIEAGKSGLPAGDTADVGALRQQVEGMRSRGAQPDLGEQAVTP